VAGQIGLEETPEIYVEKLVAVFREVKRALKNDGIVFLNLGDSYNGSGGPGSQYDNKAANGYKGEFQKFKNPNRKIDNLKPKDLIGIPWMVAFALRADGWWLRQDIIWAKPNPMPESVTDRCTKSHEYIFLLTKSARYYYDAGAIAELANYDGRRDEIMKGSEKYKNGFVPNQSMQTFHARGHRRWNKNNVGERIRNRRDVWTMNTAPYKGAHFATFPPELPRLCILAGSRLGDVVLDPFCGSGTTLAVAKELGRHWIGVDISEKYCELSRKRVAAARVPLFVE